jgi:hypothetical protein
MSSSPPCRLELAMAGGSGHNPRVTFTPASGCRVSAANTWPATRGDT